MMRLLFEWLMMLFAFLFVIPEEMDDEDDLIWTGPEE